MISSICKECKKEIIIYNRVDDERVNKCHFNKSGQKTKEKLLNVREIHQNRRSHRNTQDFFVDMIFNHSYKEIS